MLRYCLIILTLYCLSVVGKENIERPESTTTNPDENVTTGPKTCSHHSNFGARLSCIGEKFSAKAISAEVANIWTHEALRMLDLPDKYYSIGVVTGTETKLVMGRQDSYAFDWALTFPLAVYNAFSADTLILNEPSSKPALIYSRDVSTEIQTMPEWSLIATVPDLSNDMKPLYRHPDAKGGSFEKDCKMFEEWKMREFAKETNIAVIMPSNLWCPESANAFEIYVASVLPAGEKENKRMWYFEWYRERDDSFGGVPLWATTTHFL